MTKVRIMVVVACISAGVLAVPAGAGARTPTIHGDLRCVVGPAQMHFVPPLVNASTNPNPSKSRVTFTASVTACRGTTPASPAPGGIHRGVAELKGRLRKNVCLDLGAEGPGAAGEFLDGPQRLTLTWYDVSGARIGRNRYGADQAGLEIVYDDFFTSPLNPIATIPFSSTLRSTAKAFGGETALTNVPVDLTDFSARCGTGPVAELPLLGGEISIGNPT